MCASLRCFHTLHGAFLSNRVADIESQGFLHQVYFATLMDRTAHGFSPVMCASLRCFHTLHGAFLSNRIADIESQGFLHKFYFTILMDHKAHGFSPVMCASHDANFAPNPEETDGEAANPGPRMRRRGPRSEASKSERRAAGNRRAQEQETPADSSFVWSEAKFRILHVNIRGWISHAAELAARIRQMQERPDLICVNETFLDRTVEHIILEGYTLIARLDRSDGRKC